MLLHEGRWLPQALLDRLRGDQFVVEMNPSLMLNIALERPSSSGGAFSNAGVLVGDADERDEVWLAEPTLALDAGIVLSRSRMRNHWYTAGLPG